MFDLIDDVKCTCDEIRCQNEYLEDLIYKMLDCYTTVGVYNFINDLDLSDYETIEDEMVSLYDNIAICEHCGVVGFIDDEMFIDDDTFYCSDCYEEHHRINTINTYHGYDINDYSSGFDYTMGIELETEFPNDHLKQEMAKNYYGDFTMSNDGSLDYGVEFVSPIYDVSDLDDTIREQLEIINKVVLEHDGYCHNSINSGLHVHFCLDAIQDKVKLWDFVYSNKEFFMSVGARKAEFLAFKWCKPYYNLVRVGSHYEVDDRYCLININTTYDTVEFRFMNSNLKPNTLVIKIKFLILLVEYVNKSIMPTKNDFLEYIKSEDEGVYNYTIKWYNKRLESIKKLCNDYFN